MLHTGDFLSPWKHFIISHLHIIHIVRSICIEAFHSFPRDLHTFAMSQPKLQCLSAWFNTPADVCNDAAQTATQAFLFLPKYKWGTFSNQPLKSLAPQKEQLAQVECLWRRFGCHTAKRHPCKGLRMCSVCHTKYMLMCGIRRRWWLCGRSQWLCWLLVPCTQQFHFIFLIDTLQLSSHYIYKCIIMRVQGNIKVDNRGGLWWWTQTWLRFSTKLETEDWEWSSLITGTEVEKSCRTPGWGLTFAVGLPWHKQYLGRTSVLNNGTSAWSFLQ